MLLFSLLFSCHCSCIYQIITRAHDLIWIILLLPIAHYFSLCVLPGSVSTRRPGKDQGGAKDGYDVSTSSWTRRAGRNERRGERRAAQRRCHQPAQRRGTHHRGTEEWTCQETATGRTAVTHRKYNIINFHREITFNNKYVSILWNNKICKQQPRRNVFRWFYS